MAVQFMCYISSWQTETSSAVGSSGSDRSWREAGFRIGISRSVSMQCKEWCGIHSASFVMLSVFSGQPDSSPPLGGDYTTVVANERYSLPRSRSESQNIQRIFSPTLPQEDVYPSSTSHNQPLSGWVSNLHSIYGTTAVSDARCSSVYCTLWIERSFQPGAVPPQE